MFFLLAVPWRGLYTIFRCFFLFTAMGNEKANSYWEAELPPNYDRVGIENFIRAKYVVGVETI